MEKIQVSGPSITQKEIDAVINAVKNGWYDNADLYQGRFEKAMANYLKVWYTVSLPSCTSAIHLSLLSLGIGPGDEVIVPEITWIGSAAPITYVGAKTVFADVDEDTWCLSASSLERCVSPRTRAVVVVDLYGNMPRMNEIFDIASHHGISVIEDAAQAIGAEYQGRQAGSLGDIGVFSFHGSKLIITGEGGMLVTHRKDVYERVLVLRDHGRQPGDKMFWNTEVAFKYKMGNLQAALGEAQLERIEELLCRKRKIFDRYQEELSSLEGVTLNQEMPQTKNSYWMVTVMIDPKFGLKKEQLIEQMARYQIDCRPFFYPLSCLPAYAGSAQAETARRWNQISYKLSPYGVNLPSGMNMTEEKIHFVCDHLKKILNRK